MNVNLNDEEIEWLIRVCDRAIRLMDMGFEHASPVMDDRKKISVLMTKLKLTTSVPT